MPDTVPSRAAEEVLASIPEPLRPEERVPAPDAAAGEARSGEPVDAASDSADASESDSGSTDVPTPEPTPVLGERPLPEILPPADSALAGPPGALPGKPPAAPPAGLTPPDTCWRVQIGAPTERIRAERYLDAGQSQLLLPMVIEKEKGLYKVRTRDCMGGSAADALRRRAKEAGFGGAFRFPGRRP